jgi:membrane-associated phospholipid phosphatase
MPHLRQLVVASVLLNVAFAPAFAQADSAKTRKPFFTWRDVALLEAFALATVASAPLDRRFAERLQNQTVQERRSLADLAHVVETITEPGSVLIGAGLYAYGRLRGNRRAADLGLHGLEALLIGEYLGWTLKGIVGRARPYLDITNPHDYSLLRGARKGGDYRSFPSGHTIAAFAAAAAVTSETKLWSPKSVWIIGPILYGGAALVGWSRMFDNQHWATDVLTGAAIGTFAGLKVVHYHHVTNPDNRFDRFFLGTSVTPTARGDALLRMHFQPPF